MAIDISDLDEEEDIETGGDESHEDDEGAIEEVVEEISTGAISFDPMSILGALLPKGVPQPRLPAAAKAVKRRVIKKAKAKPKVTRRIAVPRRDPAFTQGASTVTLEQLRQQVNFQQLAYVNDSVAATATETQTFTIQQDGLALAMYVNPAAGEIVFNSITYMGMPWIILGPQSASGWIATAQHSPPISPKELRSGANLTSSVTNNAGAAVQLTWSVMGIPWQNLRSEMITPELRQYLNANGYDIGARFGMYR